MAHLIKLEDYVSRYQYDMYRYPSQFSRLKRERWERLKAEWEASKRNNKTRDQEAIIEEKKFKLSPFQKLKSLYKRGNREPLIETVEPVSQFTYTTLSEVKTIFWKELFDFQLNWASSTLREISTLKTQYYFDETLKWFLQSFPDNYFLLYYPTVTYPKATIQFDIVLIGPTDIWCIVLLNGSENTIFQTNSDRFWLQINGEEEKKIINPFLSLNRMGGVIKRLLEDSELDLNVKKAVITRKGYIDVDTPWSVTSFIDQRNITEWNDKQKNNSSPIKSVQLKFSQYLLDVCQTTSTLRYDQEEYNLEEEGNIEKEEY